MACLASIILTLLNDWVHNSLIDEFSFSLVKLVNGGAMVKFVIRGVRVNRDSNRDYNRNFRLHIV